MVVSFRPDEEIVSLESPGMGKRRTDWDRGTCETQEGTFGTRSIPGGE